MIDPAIEVANLLDNCRSLLLATMDANGIPQASPAPFIHDDVGQFHVLVSAMAPHTPHLADHKPTGIMLIEDEKDALQIFARKRVSYTCNVTEIFRDTHTCQELMDRFNSQFGPIVDRLAELPDFRMFRLHPVSGRLVVGFGHAYRLEGSLITPIGPHDLN